LAEWQVEHGIGESRALLVENGRPLAAKLRWSDELYAGKPVELRLARKPAGSRRGIATDEAGRAVLVDRLPLNLTEGQAFAATITRAPIAERGRHKLAAARAGAAPGGEDIFAAARVVRRFAPGLWEDICESAAAGSVAFAGGSLLLSATPAMMLVDVDGELPPRELALAAAPALAEALRLFDCGGSIGIDFPTLAEKTDRRAVDEALAAELAGWPHERTAMNGFGFVQIVARLEGPSLLHRLAYRPAGAAARMALRRAERVEGPGVTLLTVHPSVKAAILPEWQAELERRTGRLLRIAVEPGLAPIAATAQIVAP